MKTGVLTKASLTCRCDGDNSLIGIGAFGAGGWQERSQVKGHRSNVRRPASSVPGKLKQASVVGHLGSVGIGDQRSGWAPKGSWLIARGLAPGNQRQ